GVGTTDDSDQFDSFTAIDAQHEFYITDSGKLMISFDKYEVAPGYMGVVEFEIPTNILQNILVSNEYIQ
ncbi:MAG: RsiV family protein, partial [Lysinibacillus sp.]